MNKLLKTLCFVLAAALMTPIFGGCAAKPSGEELSSTSSQTAQSQNDTSEVEKLELPFEPITRPALKSDTLPAICEPKLSGDFIQSWICHDWSYADWQIYINVLKKAGFNFLILQFTTGRQNAKYTEFCYPTGMAKDKSISAEDCKVYERCVDTMLKAAEDMDFKTYIGIGGDSDWWDYTFTDIEWCKREAELTNRCIKELYELYKEKYPNAFTGWYWAWEMFSCKDKHEVNWSQMININLDYMTSLDPSMPCIFSPFYSSYEDAGAERVKEEYTYLMAHTNFRDGDIFAPQDSIGAQSKEYDPDNNERKYSITFLEDVLIAIRDAVKTNPKVRFWVNIENFNGPGGTPAPLNRYVDQMNIASKYAEGLITFSYLHYYSPTQVEKTYNEQFKKYIAWLAQNPQVITD